ncbi:hypothetical protein MTR_7g113290 [Medicago truncatula]|uniref:Uncharacterized protein n=1 Tax=Medicago truncatula TaxID=3880 RepID=G7KYL8_MEDTR|nr:hypothetical protein MTR_7g113290 [Medicago truncatula]
MMQTRWSIARKIHAYVFDDNRLKRIKKHQFNWRVRSGDSNHAVVPIKRRRLTACAKAEKSCITENSSGGLGSDKLRFSQSSSFLVANKNVCDPISHQQNESSTDFSTDRSVEENKEKSICNGNYQYTYDYSAPNDDEVVIMTKEKYEWLLQRLDQADKLEGKILQILCNALPVLGFGLGKNGIFDEKLQNSRFWNCHISPGEISPFPRHWFALAKVSRKFPENTALVRHFTAFCSPWRKCPGAFRLMLAFGSPWRVAFLVEFRLASGEDSCPGALVVHSGEGFGPDECFNHSKAVRASVLFGTTCIFASIEKSKVLS